MFATLLIVFSVLGGLSAIADRILTDEQKDVLKRWDKTVHKWLQEVKDTPFADWMRRPKALVLLLGIAVAGLVTVDILVGFFPFPVDAILIGGCTILAGASMWWLGRSSNSISYLAKACLLTAAFFLLVPKLPSLLGLEASSDEDVIQFLGSAMIVGAITLFLATFLVVMFLPFLFAQLLSVFLYASELFFRFCTKHNKIAVFVFCAVVGGLTTIYKAFH